MALNSDKLLCQFVSRERIREIDHWIAKYPADEKASAVMATLRIVQEEHGFLTAQLMDAVAEYLDMPPIAVYEVATFYTMYELEPTARHVLKVCRSISCELRNKEILDHIEKKIGIKPGQSTKDGRFSLRSVECLGACVNAPVMQVGKKYHENLDEESVDKLLEQYQ